MHEEEVAGIFSLTNLLRYTAAIGTADTPAEPMSGLTLPPVALYIILPKSTPNAVPIQNARRPENDNLDCVKSKEVLTGAVAPTVYQEIVIIFISSF